MKLEEIKTEYEEVKKVVDSLSEDFQACIERLQAITGELAEQFKPIPQGQADSVEPVAEEVGVCWGCKSFVYSNEPYTNIETSEGVKPIHDNCNNEA